MKNEPAVVIGAIAAVVNAVVALVAFEFEWSGDRTALVMGLATACTALASAVLVRQRVTPVS